MTDALLEIRYRPIQKLPPELLQEIFLLCLPPPTRKEARMHPSAPSLLFGRVCSNWRILSTQMPVLWRTLSIYLDEEIDGRTWLPEETWSIVPFVNAISRWLALSGECLLHVMYSESSSSTHHGLLHNDRQILLRLVFNAAVRIETLELFAVASRLRTILSLPLPCLQRLSVQGRSSQMEDREFLDNMPVLRSRNLRAITVSGMVDALTFSCIPENITELELTSLPAYDRGWNTEHPMMHVTTALSTLKRFPNLVCCTLAITGDAGQPLGWREPLRLSHLECLAIVLTWQDYPGLIDVTDILRALVLPNLRWLCIGENPQDLDLLHWTEHSSYPTQNGMRLYISPYYLKAPAILEIMTHVPQATHLSIGSCLKNLDNFEDQWPSLASDLFHPWASMASTTGNAPCSLLEHVSVRFPSPTLMATSIADLLHAHAILLPHLLTLRIQLARMNEHQTEVDIQEDLDAIRESGVEVLVSLHAVE
uniref:F-box domain-containing protein n=1 Tax=Mycena chlorophos TaxID=658473 RepID=A0ABQ0LE07_MYCCL|nr:predicted protein [Mycena chlorophos]